MRRIVTIIPARHAALRLPGKPLADIAGKPMIQWVYEAAARARTVAETWVATDDERIAAAVRGFGGRVVMTSPEMRDAARSGTDRVALAAEALPPADVYVNVQGDEPLMDPRAVDAAAELVASGRFTMGTVMSPLRTADELRAPTVVKVIADRAGRAIYFSRLPIPYGRAEIPAEAPFVARRHVGLYSYSPEVLRRLRDLPVSPLETAESLEQLRAMDHGIAIGVTEVDFDAIGVDTPEDLELVRRRLAS